MRIINVTDGMTSILLGRMGENEATQVVFDVSDWLEEYPGAAIALINQVPHSSEEYPVVISAPEDGKVKWTVGGAELLVEGYGNCSLEAVVGNTVAKKHIWRTRILPGMGQPGEAPDPWDSWITEFARMTGEAQDAVEDAEDAKDAAEDAQAAAETAQTAAERAAGIALAQGGEMNFSINNDGDLILSYTDQVPIDRRTIHTLPFSLPRTEMEIAAHEAEHIGTFVFGLMDDYENVSIILVDLVIPEESIQCFYEIGHIAGMKSIKVTAYNNSESSVTLEAEDIAGTVTYLE